ncbi:CRP/FNR family transcriptional regulator, anaerobic regulatory protein [Marinococcus luteus]|uniref:CRP/FNR family transcriptional regulator, anaerobic regulatory protein n=1 Tax=Marinococcus luteus TaxID=1122204 RepID=A0A1H2R165_9BACI|nr:Crp/Fnr family transcriptional regulator [Marinococcus luteus]SDW12880.1 CRP/FNR family transcriptional regulator, anaerobic regulatory protein [Marinococcus luteus]
MSRPLQSLPAHEKPSGSFASMLSPEEFDRFQARTQLSYKRAGTYLYSEGDPSDYFYFLYSGTVKIQKSTSDGKELTITLLGSGDLAGEYGSLQAVSHDFSAKVTADSMAGVIKKTEVEALIKESGTFSLKMMQWMGSNTLKEQSKFRDLLLYGKNGALASTLIRLSTTHGIGSEHGTIVLQLKLTNAELGEYIGLSREGVNRCLNVWKKAGVISYENGCIAIHDMLYLRGLCNCPLHNLCSSEICRL